MISGVLAVKARNESEPTIEALARQLLDLVFAFRNRLDDGERDGISVCEVHNLRKLRDVILSQEPISLILPAFPAKSPNPEKTSGELPDLGEVIALQNLNDLCRRMSALYAPGASLVICSDGRVFSDLVRVADPVVDRYAEGIRQIIRDYELAHLTTYNLEDVFGGMPYDEMRAKLVAEFAEPVADIRERVTAQSDYRNLFNGIHRFLFEDHLVLDSHLSRNQVRLRSKALAYEVVQRSNAWSRLLEREFPSALRLSIHPQSDLSKKIGVQLLQSGSIWQTPWHAVTLSDGKSFWLAKRKEAEALNAKEMQWNETHSYFRVGWERLTVC